MALCLRRTLTSRPLILTSRCYCDNKSIYQRDEEGPKERTIYGKPYPEWRKPWIQREGEWYSKFSVFVEKNPSPYILNAMQNLPYLDSTQVKDWWSRMKEVKEIQNQKYLAKRVEVLGSNLAAAHFFTYRGASIRWKGSTTWLSGLEENMKLPHQFEDKYFIEAVDCSKFMKGGIRYEGLMNLMGVNFIKWLSLKDNKHVDVWCLDRLAGQNGESIEYLDITGCKICVGCVYALARMEALKCVVMTDPGDNLDLQAALSVLEEEKPDLLINAVKALD